MKTPAMKTTIVLALFASLLACSGPPPADPETVDGADVSVDEPTETGRRLISIGADALDTAREIAAANGADIEIVETNADVAVIRFPAEHFRALSEAMHDRHHRCGGFQLHEGIDDAILALRAKDYETMTSFATDYSLDDAATVNAVMPTLDQARILSTIQQLSAMKNRYYTSATGAAASTWLRDRWRGLTTRTDVTVELVDHGYPQKSVVLRIQGTTRPNEVIVLGGHLDSIASGGASSTAPGADDDASGIATLTEIARALLAKDYRPARTIEIIGYAAEEVGLRGSQAIAKDRKARAVNVVGVMQLDMTNYQGSDKDIWLMQDYTNTAQNAFVIQLIEAYTGATWGTDSCGYGCSDHASWHSQGFPASMPFESRADEYNPAIHTSNDTLEMSDNNAAHAVKFARLGVAFAIELGGGGLGTQVPTNTPPTLSILAPVSGASIPAGTQVELRGTANDAEDGNLSAMISWSSSRDGALGIGATRMVTLSTGSHTITATARDSKQVAVTRSVTVEVTAGGTTLFSDNFEGATPWTMSGLWHATTSSTCASPGYASPVRALYYGRDATCTYNTGARTTGSATSPAITGITSTTSLRFKHYRKVEAASGSYDVASVAVVNGSTVTTIWSQSSAVASPAAWTDSGSISLAAYAGRTIQLRFTFDSKDSYANAFTGWFVDDVIVAR